MTTRRRAAAIALAALSVGSVAVRTGAAGAVGRAGTDGPPVFRATGRTIRVPADTHTIQAAVNRAKPGDLVLVSPGVYKESVAIKTDGVVVRGADRNRTVLEGGFRLDNGIVVDHADGVAIENLTARDYTDNGFYWTGVSGYRGSYLTAYRNGDYGIYAFDSQWGQFDHSYASGSPDSGFYIGQCNPCHAVITDVVSEYNELGYSGTNSSNDILVVNSTWRHNRAGIVPNTLDSEKLPPQGHATIVGNLVDANGSGDAAHAKTAEFDAVFGGGIVVVGGTDNTISRNRVTANTRFGIGIAPNPGIQQNVYPSTGNHVQGNVVAASGIADLAIVLPVAGDGNCFAANTFTTTAPSNLEQLEPCTGTGSGDPNAGALDLGALLDPSKNPPGRSYRQTPRPPPQPSMPNAKSAKAQPASDVPLRVNLDAIRVPVG